jgi:hypothetical protein
MLCDKIINLIKIYKFYLAHLMVAIPLSVLVLFDSFFVKFYVPELLDTHQEDISVVMFRYQILVLRKTRGSDSIQHNFIPI